MKRLVLGLNGLREVSYWEGLKLLRYSVGIAAKDTEGMPVYAGYAVSSDCLMCDFRQLFNGALEGWFTGRCDGLVSLGAFFDANYPGYAADMAERFGGLQMFRTVEAHREGYGIGVGFRYEGSDLDTIAGKLPALFAVPNDAVSFIDLYPAFKPVPARVPADAAVSQVPSPAEPSGARIEPSGVFKFRERMLGYGAFSTYKAVTLGWYGIAFAGDAPVKRISKLFRDDIRRWFKYHYDRGCKGQTLCQFYGSLEAAAYNAFFDMFGVYLFATAVIGELPLRVGGGGRVLGYPETYTDFGVGFPVSALDIQGGCVETAVTNLFRYGGTLWDTVPDPVFYPYV